MTISQRFLVISLGGWKPTVVPTTATLDDCATKSSIPCHEHTEMLDVLKNPWGTFIFIPFKLELWLLLFHLEEIDVARCPKETISIETHETKSYTEEEHVWLKPKLDNCLMYHTIHPSSLGFPKQVQAVWLEFMPFYVDCLTDILFLKLLSTKIPHTSLRLAMLKYPSPVLVLARSPFWHLLSPRI